MTQNRKQIYLDHSATTPTDPRVVEAMLPYFGQYYGNASSIHSFGQQAKVALEDARKQIANVINAEPGEIIFTSGGTEANNWAIKGAASFFEGRKSHLITAKTEHHAVLFACQFLQKKGCEVTYVRVDDSGYVDPDDVARAIKEQTFLVSIMHANNETGTLNPVAEIGEITRAAGVFFHTDAVQTFGKIPIDVNQMKIDFLSLSGHKLYGPKGVGALYMRQGLQLDKLLHGGKHERDRRAGTENVPGATGLGKAAELSLELMESDFQKLAELRDELQNRILSRIDGVRLNGDKLSRHPGILNLSFDGVESDSLLLSLDLKGIAVSNGSACTSGSVEPSHVLQAMGLSKAIASSAIRFSLGRQNTLEEVDYTVNALVEILARLRKFKKR